MGLLDRLLARLQPKISVNGFATALTPEEYGALVVNTSVKGAERLIDVICKGAHADFPRAAAMTHFTALAVAVYIFYTRVSLRCSQPFAARIEAGVATRLATLSEAGWERSVLEESRRYCAWMLKGEVVETLPLEVEKIADEVVGAVWNDASDAKLCSLVASFATMTLSHAHNTLMPRLGT